MIVALSATIQEISDQGEHFNWPVLDCEKCSYRMWGHGFVVRYFEGISSGLRIKRLICHGCGMVVVFRPKGFFARFRSLVSEIYSTLCFRLRSGHWPKGFSRQRGWYWLRCLMSAVVFAGNPSPLLFLEDRLSREVHFFT